MENRLCDQDGILSTLGPSLAVTHCTSLRASGRRVTCVPETCAGGHRAGWRMVHPTMWENRVWVHILYRIVTMFHVMHEGLGPKLELTHNPAWGEHCRKEALAHAALMNQHLSDGRPWILGKDEPTFADITLCVAIAFSKFPVNATPLDERFEHLDAFWQRWKARPSFQQAYADGGSGLAELEPLQAR